MSGQCCGPETSETRLRDAAYRRVLWAALAINGVMFTVEIGAGLVAGSVALQADALDFLGDTATYAISLFVIGMSLRARARAALVKGGAMALLGFWVAGATVWQIAYGGAPEAFTMGAVGFAALLANAAVFALLLALPRGRQQHAFRLALFAQRCPRQLRRASRGAWRLRHGHGLARHRGRGGHVDARASGRMGRAAAGTRRTWQAATLGMAR